MPPRAERLLYLSAAARRIGDLVAASDAPLRYEVLRHLLRVSEETMTEALEEAVAADLVRRGDDPFSYVPGDDDTGAAIREAMGELRAERLREHIVGATRRVFGDEAPA
ncbi:MAG TPA: hypothetical protein VFC53_02380 [Dehalococcoidia bacterium]|nr:hypothetical protein [Dehalococcoidia bacterium]